MLTILCHDDELAFVDLLLDDIVRVDLELLADHLPGGHRAHRATAVDADQEEVVQVDLVALRKLVYAHRIAALHRHSKALIPGAVQVLLDQFREQERPAVKRSSRPGDLVRVGDQCRHRLVEVSTFLDRQHAVDDIVLQGKLEEPGHRTAALSDVGKL